MDFAYVPLLQVARDLMGLPRGLGRFRRYLRTLLNDDETDVERTPLLLMNPMGRDHVAALLDELLALDADGIGARAAAAVSTATAGVPGRMRTSLMVLDDLKGGWTNRPACEFQLRFGARPIRDSPGARRRAWATAALWSSEPPSARAADEAVRTAAYRAAYVARHGPAVTLRAMLAQEGAVLAAVGGDGPALDADDLAYTREVIAPLLDADDPATAVACLFGDDAARTLGFTPLGLSPGAGLALARHDARSGGVPPPAQSSPRSG